MLRSLAACAAALVCVLALSLDAGRAESNKVGVGKAIGYVVGESLKAQFITSALMRLGTSPTGMTAFTFLAAVSIAVMDRSAALEM